ncbi:MAG: FAD-dependent oxidoreductase [Bacilli bacterium]
MSEKKKIVVIGGVAGGMSFANRYRRLNINDEIIVFDKGPYVSFANCGLPYFISGEVNSRSRLLVVRKEELVTKFNLVIRENSEVIRINPQNKTITYINDNQEKEEDYDKLVLSMGAKPILPIIPGMETIPSFILRNIPHIDSLMSFIKEHNPKRALVIGAGFIGLEVAENLAKRGIAVTIVEKAPQVLPPFDPEMAAFAEEELTLNNIKVYTDNEVIKIDHQHIYLKNGQELNADFVIASIGVMPDTELAAKSGIKLGIKNGIIVDENYMTSIPDIYAIGDAIIVKNQISNQEALISLASPANREGRQLADVLSGLSVTNRGSISTAIVRLFNRTFASTGLNERQLKGRDYRVVHLQTNDHASYYPGATLINLKVLFDPNTEMILGAQAVGEKGVDKRIDVIATAMKGHIKVSDLQELELTYSPPFGSAKDIVNLAGYVAQNVILGVSKTYQWYEVDRLLKEGALFVDVRTELERLSDGYIEGSLSIDAADLYERYHEIPKNRKIVVYCESGTRSYNAERILRAKGYDVYNLDGSYGIYGRMKGRK